jgi:hypothetical protein
MTKLYPSHQNRRLDCYMINIRVEESLVINTRDIIFKYFREKDKIQKNPHITLFQCITLNHGNDEAQLFNIFEDCIKNYTFLPYTIDGFFGLKWWSKTQRVIAHKIQSSPELDQFTKCMVNKLFSSKDYQSSLADGTWTDKHSIDKELHITIAWKLSIREAEKIWGWLDQNPGYFYKFLSLFKLKDWNLLERKIAPIHAQYEALRLTFYKNNKIIGEYDLPRKQWIMGNDLWDKKQWAQTVVEYKKIKQNRSNP